MQKVPRQFLFNFLLLPLFSVCFPVLLLANNPEHINRLDQRSIGSLLGIDEIKGDEGLAGSFAGVLRNSLIIAGGTAFPEGKPWENGLKYFSDAILVFDRTSDGTLQVRENFLKLPIAVGEGASVTVPSGLVCIGGLTPEGVSDAVFLISGTDEMNVQKLPSLPVPVKFPAAAAIGSRIYLVGGENTDGATSHFLMLNIERISDGWQKMPDFPVPVSAAMTVAQMDGEEVSLFVFGGRSRHKEDHLTTFYSHVYRFRPSSGAWKKMNNIQTRGMGEINLAAASAVPVGASHVIIIGGDNGVTYNQVEQAIHAIEFGESGAQLRRDSLWIHHPGFNNRILIYNTITDSWFNEVAWEGNPIAVAPAVNLANSIIIPGGEIRPGIRSPEISQLTFSVYPVFGWVNYIVLGTYFGGMLFLGFFFMKKEGDTNDFFKAGGRIPWWAAGISIFATTLSAITFISIPAKAYATDWRMFIYNMSIILIAPVVIRYYLPFFRRFNFDTAYEYLSFRFDKYIRWLAASLFVIFMISRIAIVLFLPSLALNAVTGFSVYWSIIIMGVVTIIYCTSGGMEAVVWGDVIQGFILMTGALVALVFMLYGVEGGLSGFLDISMHSHKFHTFDFKFDLSQPVFWVVLIGGLANTLISFTSDQSVVQRYMTTKDEKATGRSIWLNGILSIPVTIIFFLLGTALYAYYSSNPERLAVTNPNIDSVFPQFIVAQMPAGVAGLLIAAIFAAAMSTLSSNINSVAAVFTSDFYKVFSAKSSVHQRMVVARWSGIIAGVTGMAMALILATWNIASLWDQFNTFVGLLTGSLGALFLMGIFFPGISGRAALMGTLGSLMILMAVKNFTPLSFLLYGLIGLSASVLFALVISIFFPNRKPVIGLTWISREIEKPDDK